MFKTNIKPQYSEVLTAQLKKEFGIEFTSIDAGDHVGLIEDRELTEWTKDQIQTAVNMFEAGIQANESKIDGLRDIFERALQGVHEL